MAGNKRKGSIGRKLLTSAGFSGFMFLASGANGPLAPWLLLAVVAMIMQVLSSDSSSGLDSDDGD